MHALTGKQRKGLNKRVRKFIDKYAHAADGQGPDFIEEIRQLLRERARRDLWFLCFGVLGFKDMNNKLHKEMAAVWQRRQHFKYTLWMAPRFHLKTTMWVIGDTVRVALNDPNETCCIISAKLDNCVSMLNTIRAQFDTNAVLRWLFPEYCMDLADVQTRKRCSWTSERIDWPCRDSWISTSGNLEVMSVGASMVSKHFGWLRFDDAVNDINSTSIPLCVGVHNWFLDAWQLRVDFESFIRVTGTPWSFADFYQREMEKEKKRRLGGREPKLRTYRKPVYLSNGEPIWPERYGKDELEDLKEHLGSYKFACNFELDPVPEGAAIFKKGQIQEIHELEVPQQVVNFIGVDLSEEDSKTPDHTVITVVSIDEFGNWYVRRIVRGKFYPLGIMETVAKLCQKYAVEKVGVDATGFQTTIFKEYLKWSTKEKVYVPWVPMKFGKQSKPGRIRALQPIFERMGFHAVMGIENYSVLEEEAVTFDRGRSDDILDTLSIVQIIYYEAPAAVNPEMPERLSINGLYGDITKLGTDDYDGPNPAGVSPWGMDDSFSSLY